jgi:hypothetical protein
MCRYRGEEKHIHFGGEGKPERKKPLWRPTMRWKNNIKMDLKVVECGV